MVTRLRLMCDDCALDMSVSTILDNVMQMSAT